MAIIKESIVDFTTLGTPSTNQFYLGFDLDGSLKYKNSSGTIVAPGGGGTVSGTPSQIAYFDQDGNLSSDAGFLRGTSSSALIVDNGTFSTGIIMGNNLFGGVATASVIYYVDQNSGDATYIGAGNINGFSASMTFIYNSGDNNLHNFINIVPTGVIITAQGTSYGNGLFVSPQSIFMGGNETFGTQSVDIHLEKGDDINIGSNNLLKYLGLTGMAIVASASDGGLAISGVISSEDALNIPAMAYLSISNSQYNVLTVGTNSIELGVSKDNSSFITLTENNVALGYSSGTSSFIYIDELGPKWTYNGITFSLPTIYGLSGSALITDDVGNLTFSNGFNGTYSTGDGRIATITYGIITDVS